MTETTLTIRVSPATGGKLARLARETRRSSADLAAGAVAAYVDRELAVVAGIRQSREDIAAGRVISHEDAMAELDAIVAGEKTKPAR